MSHVVSIARHGQIFERDSFYARYDDCVNDILSFASEAGITYDNCRLLDVGSGDGIIDLGVAQRTGSRVFGIDIIMTDRDALIAGSREHGITLDRGSLDFSLSADGLLQFPDAYFDHAFSRDVFEHVFDPVTLLKAVHRVLEPGGTFCVQIWPLWHSEWGAHLFERQAPWEHLVRSRSEILSRWEGIWQAHASYDSCARTSIDDLQRACLAANFRAVRVELMTPTFCPPEHADHLRWSEMGIAGIKLLLQK